MSSLDSIDPLATPAPSLQEFEESIRPPLRFDRDTALVARAFSTLVTARAQDLLDLDDEEIYPSPDRAGMVVVNSEVLNALLASHYLGSLGRRR